MSLELDPWLEGYLSYQRDVRRMAHRTVIDLRCTLKKVSKLMQSKLGLIRFRGQVG